MRYPKTDSQNRTELLDGALDMLILMNAARSKA
jgi:hypothetical protein